MLCNHKKSFYFILGLLSVLFFSCSTEVNTSFSKNIVYQKQLNKTDFFNIEGVDTYKINYLSDGFKIEGFIAKPKKLSAEKLPAIIFCRGGNQSFGMLNGMQLQMINQLAAKGFIVLASQLRGNISSEGIDEFGGDDVNDILKLITIAKDIDFIDDKNIHVLGYSRGGMNAYQVSKLTDEINCLAVVGASTNKFEAIKFRENMYHNVYKPLFGDTLHNRDAYMKRSAIYWHSELNEPTLILHGDEDARVSVKEAEQLIDSLQQSNKKDFDYKIFEHGNHPLSNFSEQRDNLIINWFKTHSK